MLIRFGVSDVNGAAVPDARITVTHTSPAGPEPTSVTLGPGETWDAPLALNQLDVQVSAGRFAEEKFLFAASGAGWWGSNPAGAAVRHGDRLEVSTTIGAIRLAPTVHVRSDEPLRVNPRAALVDPTGGPDWIYRGAFHNVETIRRLDDPIFGDLTAAEWRRFRNSRVMVDLARHGRFILLEFGPRPTAGGRLPRFLIGTWAPLKAMPAVPEVVVFFAPPTYANRDFPPDAYPFLNAYPYAIEKPAPAAKAAQPYVGYLVNYLLNGYKIIYQLVAAGRNPIVIMPSQPSARWGPLNTQAGLGRLVKEVIRFLYARQIVTSRTTPLVKVRLVNGRTSLFPPEGRRSEERVPKAFVATLSGFSAGINAVVNICRGAPFDEKSYEPHEPDEFRRFFHSPPGDLTDNWRELWDIDGVDNDGWQHMVQTFRRWASGGDRRSLRSYHSGETYHGIAQNGLVPQPLVVRRPARPVDWVYAEEGHTTDGRMTWVHFSNPALTGNRKAPGHEATLPEFGGDLDPHHLVPAIAFGHAARFPLP